MSILYNNDLAVAASYYTFSHAHKSMMTPYGISNFRKRVINNMRYQQIILMAVNVSENANSVMFREIMRSFFCKIAPPPLVSHRFYRKTQTLSATHWLHTCGEFI